MRALLLLALLGTPALGGDMEVDIGSFADALEDRLEVGVVEAWEERLDPAAEAAWVGSGARAPDPATEVDEDERAARGGVTVGASARVDGRVTLTRLWCPDAARAQAIVAAVVRDAGGAWERETAPFLPLATGPRGRPIAPMPILVEPRGAQALIIRGPLRNAEVALALRAAAWDAPGFPAADEAFEALLVLDVTFEVTLARRDVHAAQRDGLDAYLSGRLEPDAQGATSTRVAFGGSDVARVAYAARLDAEPIARALTLDLARRLGLPTELPE